MIPGINLINGVSLAVERSTPHSLMLIGNPCVLSQVNLYESAPTEKAVRTDLLSVAVKYTEDYRNKVHDQADIVPSLGTHMHFQCCSYLACTLQIGWKNLHT